MKPKTIVLMVVAIVCGLGASYMTSRLLADRNTEAQEPERVTILVAKKNLEQNLALKEKDLKDLFEEKYYPKGEEPVEDPLNSFDQLKGKFLKHQLRKGDFVTNKDITEEQMAIDLQPGMRAVGIRVNLESIAGGFASLPGSRVDICATVRRSTDDDSQSFTLLENVLVLAADTRSTKGENSAAMPASVVTVALTPEDQLRVNMAKEFGTLSLGLRRMGDNTKSEQKKVTAGDLFRNKKGNEVTIGNAAELAQGAPPLASVEVNTPKKEEQAPPTSTPATKPATTVVTTPATKPATTVVTTPATKPATAVVTTPATKPATAVVTTPAPIQNRPVRTPYTVVMTVGDRTVTKTVLLDAEGEVVMDGAAPNGGQLEEASQMPAITNAPAPPLNPRQGQGASSNKDSTQK